MVMLDLDHFKAVNDTYGHGVGDTVLRKFAALLRSCVRETDTPGRLGGEEFGVLLPETTMEAAIPVVRTNPEEEPGKYFYNRGWRFTLHNQHRLYLFLSGRNPDRRIAGKSRSSIVPCQEKRA